jgi:hypothetical protein
MKPEFIFDTFELDASKAVITEQGFLRCDAVITRTGVFTYMNADGTKRLVLRTPEEVFKQESLDSFKLLPITNDHPPEFVNADNAKKYQIGYTGETFKPVGKTVVATLTITDAGAIADIRKGKKELSCGYFSNIVDESGDSDDGPFTQKQTNIKGNHVAICEQARAGHVASIPNFDSVVFFQVPTQPNNERNLMSKILINGIEYDAVPEVKVFVDSLTAQVAEKTADAKTQIEKLTAERDVNVAKVVDLQKQLDAAPSVIAAKMAARQTLVATAKEVLGEKMLILLAIRKSSQKSSLPNFPK